MLILRLGQLLVKPAAMEISRGAAWANTSPFFLWKIPDVKFYHLKYFHYTYLNTSLHFKNRFNEKKLAKSLDILAKYIYLLWDNSHLANVSERCKYCKYFQEFLGYETMNHTLLGSNVKIIIYLY